jgi:glycosyltransferase involved in cell wall biosynthesis
MPNGTVVELSSHQAPQRLRAPRVSVVIPTYNEAKNLPHVFGLLPDDVHEVIVVDGHSVDDTIEVARSLRPDVVIVRQNRRGKGNAMACGFEAVTGDIVVMLDADGSADPREIERYVAALVDGADFAKGTRFAPGGGSADITKLRAWGNRWLNRIANAFFGTRYTDLCYGYNAFWAHCLPALELDASDRGSSEKLWGDGFEIETLINTRIAKAGLSITEVPSYEEERIFGQSNLNTWRDGFRVLRALLVERFNGKGRDVEIVRTEPRDVAPVIQLPVRFEGNRVIQPLDVPAGTLLAEDVVYDPESYDPGPLARALMALQAAEAR